MLVTKVAWLQILTSQMDNTNYLRLLSISNTIKPEHEVK